MTVKPGVRCSSRAANRRSCQMVAMAVIHS
jgi:hypothetical protein